MHEDSQRTEPDSLNGVHLSCSLLGVIVLGLSNVNFAALLSVSKVIFCLHVITLKNIALHCLHPFMHDGPNMQWLNEEV